MPVQSSPIPHSLCHLVCMVNMQGSNDSAWKLYLNFEPDGLRMPMAQLAIGLMEPQEGMWNSGISAPLMKLHPGFVWMSMQKNFQPCPDDGASTGLLLLPLIAVAFLLSAVHKVVASPNSGLLPRGWLIEAPHVLMNGQSPPSALKALILSRQTLVDYAVLCSFILMVQILASSWYEACYRWCRSIPKGEQGSVPCSEMRHTCEGTSGVRGEVDHVAERGAMHAL
ncbi:hypothetical protein EDC04DRAFT_2615282 [Pisolithus marmoratus]|nr:hypothetical protein EDC04DRAFT_2615282 [Pisolithus marmoratus]